jgi:DNA ligase-1
MKNFAALFQDLDRTNKTNERVRLLRNYFEQAEDKDKVWTLAIFSGRKPKRPFNSTLLKNWAIESAAIPPWLFEECYHVVGDLAETIALLLPEPDTQVNRPLSWWIAHTLQLQNADDAEKKAQLLKAWKELSRQERFVYNKIITGSFRVGVSQNLVVTALASLTGLEKSLIFHKIMGNWDPAVVSFQELLYEEGEPNVSRPYPFFLAYALEDTPESLGEVMEWQVEWKWDGIRSQLIKRSGQFFIWSRGEELITEKFPELVKAALPLPEGTVLDGEILPFKDGRPMPFNVLQTRIGRKNLSAKILNSAPVALIVYDILEYGGIDQRHLSLEERRKLTETVVTALASEQIKISPLISFDDWPELAHLRQNSRDYQAEGFMLKRKTSPYRTGRKRGDWWKWKTEPFTADAVLIYAQKGHGRRADLYTDYTFAVWNEGTLVPFAKAYSGLTDEEIKKVDIFVRKNTKEKFGPVRTVKPELVFEIAFEGIQESARHKCGIAVRFPRILKWRMDKKASDADTLTYLKNLLEQFRKLE